MLDLRNHRGASMISIFKNQCKQWQYSIESFDLIKAFDYFKKKRRYGVSESVRDKVM